MNLHFAAREIKPSRDSSIFILIAVAALIGGMLLYYFATIEQGQANLNNLQHATSLYTSPRAFPDFTLTDHHGRKFTNQNLNNTWNFIFFGFTHCPDVCPLTLGTLDQVISHLDEQDHIATQAVFISVDPKRDTPAQLGEYVQHFNQRMIGLTGSDKQLKNLTHDLGVVYTISTNSEDRDYSVDHSAHVFLVAPNGNLVALFSTPHDTQTIVHDFKILNDYYNFQNKS